MCNANTYAHKLAYIKVHSILFIHNFYTKIYIYTKCVYIHLFYAHYSALCFFN